MLTSKGKPVAMLKGMNYGSHVKTRVWPYETLKKGKGAHIAKQIVLSKVEGQNQILKRYGVK
jgi:CRISPR/Cas system-associated endonuclease Cas1